MSNELPLGGSRLVPEGWTLYSIDEIKADEKYSCVAGPFGSSISSKYFTETGVPIIRGNNLKNNLTKFVAQDFAFVSEERAKKYLPQHVKAGDLVFTCWGTIGQVGLIPQDGPYPEYIISNKQLKLRVNPDLANNLFVFYYLSSKEGVEHIRSRAIGSAVPGINLGILKSIKIALPSLSTQQSITEILSSYDRLIDNNNRRIALLEESIHLLYKEWFVRSRFPGYESVKLVDGIPEGWSYQPLEEVCELIMGQSPPSEFYNTSEQGLPFHQGVSNFGNRFVTHEIYCTQLNRIAEAGDILCSVRAPVGRLNITLDKIIIGRGLSAIRNRYGYQSFQYYQLKTHFFQEDIIGSGAIFASVTKKQLSEQLMLVPSGEIVNKFENISKWIDKQITNLYLQTQRLKQARDLLLPRLMNGSIAV
ncbi:restriction endonuclease subunit S [Nostoc sp. PCC 7107]|uniref:restriction endonuclease subunit S n=1 Tax=Nostoc sp. PCC 7107 TaxID=317936 RepID=UPI00029ECC03|nr:restriction endonuclease subunit S [Nostoc sp. PCC 7107]AFY44940.1 restriction modification system DNA specificity domain protein [Nostoc sp. PCC 7107]